MSKLELKHIAPYLPYGLKWEFEGGDLPYEVVGLDITYTGVSLLSPDNESTCCTLIDGKPILRPLMDLCKPLPNGEIPAIELAKLNLKHKSVNRRLLVDSEGNPIFECRIITKPFGGVLKVTNFDSWIVYASFTRMDNLAYFQIDYLLKYHFDVFGLIEKGLAIDKNTIE